MGVVRHPQLQLRRRGCARNMAVDLVNLGTKSIARPQGEDLAAPIALKEEDSDNSVLIHSTAVDGRLAMLGLYPPNDPISRLVRLGISMSCVRTTYQNI
jgi:hypothetical protein